MSRAKFRIRMTRTPESSNVDAYGYARPIVTLFVRFNGGRVYGYRGVPETIFSDLRAASSKGVFFNHRINDFYDTFEVTSSDEFIFVDDDSQQEACVLVLNSLKKCPQDPRWAW